MILAIGFILGIPAIFAAGLEAPRNNDVVLNRLRQGILVQTHNNSRFSKVNQTKIEGNIRSSNLIDPTEKAVPLDQTLLNLSADTERIRSWFARMSDSFFGISGTNAASFLTDIIDSVVESGSGKQKSRHTRDIGRSNNLIKWLTAYRKDPIQYHCVRKLACQTLAESSLIAESMKSPLAGVILSTVGAFIDDENELQTIVETTIGHPEGCDSMAPWGFCED